jgi:hydroxymethylbilane synthase
MTRQVVIRIGTRTSRLARWQSELIAALLRGVDARVACLLVPMNTQGDRQIDRPLPEIGGKGVFTQELEQALREGTIDVAVHSLKDLPVGDPQGITTAAICRRADPRDVLVAREAFTIGTLPQGARVGTSSTRRIAQLLAARPDLRILPLRGNVDTRVRKALDGEWDAIVLAAAGVDRLDLRDAVREVISPELMLPAPGQGALAVQCRASDEPVKQRLAQLDEHAVRAAVTAERAFLQALGGGCSAPVGALARLDSTSSQISMDGVVAATDGSQVMRVRGTGDSSAPERLGKRLATEAREAGAAALVA